MGLGPNPVAGAARAAGMWGPNGWGLKALGIGGGLLGSMMAPDFNTSFNKTMKNMDANWTGPQAFGRRQSEFYQQGLSSPMYRNLLLHLMGGNQMMKQSLGQNLGLSGLRRSAIGATARSLADSKTSFDLAGAQAGLWGQAGDDAYRTLGLGMNMAGGNAYDMKRQLLGATFGAASQWAFGGGKST